MYSIRLTGVMAVSLFFCIFSYASSALSEVQGAQGNPIRTRKTIAVVVAYQGFQNEEFSSITGILQKRNIDFSVVSSQKGIATGMSGEKIAVEQLLDSLTLSVYDAVVFIGGLGVKDEYFHSSAAHRIARESVSQGKVVGAICLAPVILANAGVLQGKKATVSSALNAKTILVDNGAVFSGEPVTVDGRIVTGRGPKASRQFAEALLRVLKKTAGH